MSKTKMVCTVCRDDKSIPSDGTDIVYKEQFVDCYCRSCGSFKWLEDVVPPKKVKKSR